MKEKILMVKELCKKYSDFILNNISFSLEKGSITGFIGQNGAGKSTTIKGIMNLINYDNGIIEYKGKKRNEKDRISYLSSGMELYPEEKIKSITKFMKKAYRKTWNDIKYNHYINIFNINESKKLKQLSTGNKMKYLIALELAKEPELILFDEPTSGLDPVIRDEILTILLNLAKDEEITIFFSSHITEDIEKIADNVIYINNGSIILDETKNEINKRFIKIHMNDVEKIDIANREIIYNKGIEKNDNYIIDRHLISYDVEFKYSPVTLDEVLIVMKGAQYD